jgi:Flp pilus assembly protein TadG
MRRQAGRRRGAQAVEFALIAPLLILVSGSIIDYGWFFTNKLIVSQAVRDAARTAAGDDSTTSPTACTVARRAANATMEANHITLNRSVTATVSQNTSTPPETLITITATVTYVPLWLPAALIPASLTVVGSARLEDQAAATCTDTSGTTT